MSSLPGDFPPLVHPLLSHLRALLGREHPVIAVAGLVALIGLVGFYVWAGVLRRDHQIRPR